MRGVLRPGASGERLFSGGVVMESSGRERAVLFTLLALFVVSIGGLVNALLQEQIRNETLQGYVMKIEYTPCQRPTES